jgi:aryl-alcohol dehydrogenase-like predicted oxidoreductase
VELEVIPAVQEYGLGFIPWSPLAGGALAGAGGGAESRRNTEWAKKNAEKHREEIARYEGFCREIGEEPAVVALGWLLHQGAVTAPIIGPRTMEQLDGTLGALELRLDEERLGMLEEIWPGPGGPAPEAYAW